MTADAQLIARIPLELAGLRLDQALAELFPAYSRSRLQQWIREGHVWLDTSQPRSRDRVLGGEWVRIDAVADESAQAATAEDIPLTIVYEDEALLVINKPAGMVVHPAAGNREGTLLNALLHHAPELAAVPRAGLVHRIDKDTTGLLVVARTLTAHKLLVEQLQARLFDREYEAVVVGIMTGGSTIEGAMARHPRDRVRMAVSAGGKPAVTHYRVKTRFRAHTHVLVKLETGRTHQIRVHMAHIHHPVVGDPVYGGRARIPAGCSAELAQALRVCKRQALHAAHLGLEHPVSGERMDWHAPLPEDMQALLEVLQQDALRVS